MRVESPSDRHDIISRLDSILEQAWYDSALNGYQAAIKVFESSGNWRGNVLARIGVGRAYGKMGKYEDARQALELAVIDARHFLDTSSLELANALSELGRIYIRQGKFKDAEAKIERALVLLSKSEIYDLHQLGEIHHLKGLLSHERGDYDKARDHYEIALSVWRQSVDRPTYSIAKTLNNLGNIHWEKGQFQKAIISHRNSLALKETILSPEHPSIAISLSNIGNQYKELQDYGSALQYYKRALAIQTLASAHPDIFLAHSLHNIGVVYSEMGNLTSAESYLSDALRLKSNLLGTTHNSIANTIFELGKVLLEANRITEAIGEFHKSKRIWVNTSHPNTVQAYRLLSLAHSRIFNSDSLQYYYRAALQSVETHFQSPHPFKAQIHNDHAEWKIHNNDFIAAIREAHLALVANIPGFVSYDVSVNPSAYESMSDTEFIRSMKIKAQGWLSLARIEKASESSLVRALETLERSSQLVERLRQGTSSDESKRMFVDQASSVYFTGVQISLELYASTSNRRYLELAFQFAESRKSRITLDRVVASYAQDRTGIPDSLLGQERDLWLRISDLKRENSMIKVQNDIDSLRLAKLENHLFDVQREYESTIRLMEIGYPEYYALKHEIGPTPVSLLRKYVLGPNEALVEYVLEPDTLLIFTLTDTDLTSVGVSVPPNMSEIVDSLRWGITRGYYAWYLEYAQKLHDLLLKPVSSAIGDRDLIVVPEGVLGYVPFEALLTEFRDPSPPWPPYSSLPYVIKDRAISYAYSSTLLYQTLTKKRKQPTKDFFALAPVFDENIELDSNARRFLSINGRDTTASGNLVSYLPGSRDEVKGIEDLFSSTAGMLGSFFYDGSLVLVGKEATEYALKNTQLNEFQYLHFATHSFANEDDPRLSGMLLLPELGDNNEDGIFHAGEAYGLTLNAELVVLSACETGVGRLTAGEGLMGLARGFLYAGAKNLVVSLWPSDDAGTKYLMLEFYRLILDGESITDALRLAKLNLIARGGLIAKPYFWSPFIHIGA